MFRIIDLTLCKSSGFLVPSRPRRQRSTDDGLTCGLRQVPGAVMPAVQVKLNAPDLNDRRSRSMSPTAADDPTEVGSYFVANYPPFSVWTPDAVERDARPALRVAAGARCRSACICTSRSAGSAVTSAISASTPTRTRSEVQGYLDVLAREWELYNAAAGDRRPAAELRLLRRRHAVVPLDPAAREPRLADGRGQLRGARPRRSRSSASRARSPRASSRPSATSA